MKSGQAEACSQRQQFHLTICASNVGYWGGAALWGDTPRGRSGGENRQHEIHTKKKGCGRAALCPPAPNGMQHPPTSSATLRYLRGGDPVRVNELKGNWCSTFFLKHTWEGKQTNKQTRYSHKRRQVFNTQNGGELCVLPGPSLHWRRGDADTLVMWLGRMMNSCLS